MFSKLKIFVKILLLIKAILIVILVMNIHITYWVIQIQIPVTQTMIKNSTLVKI
jgi:hypothetical protein